MQKRRILVELEQVDRKMIGNERESFCEILSPCLQLLPGQSGDQIDTDVIETGSARRFDRCTCVFGSMSAADHLQFTIIERLHAEAQPIYADCPQALKIILRNRSGVGFRGHFKIGGEIKISPAKSDQR